MKKTLAVLLSSTVAFPLYAQDFGRIFVLSEDVRNVVLEMPETKGLQSGKFNLTTQEADLAKNLSSMDESMNTYLDKKDKPDCPTQKGKEVRELNNRVAERNFNIYFTATGNMNSFENNALGVLEQNDYERYLAERISAGQKSAGAFSSFENLEKLYKKTHPQENYDSLGVGDKEKKLSEFLARTYGSVPPSGAIAQVITYNTMVRDGKNWKKYLGEVKGLLTSEQKITLVSEFGNKFGARYNYSRANNGPDSTYVTMEQLLLSAKNGSPGGICRDIALAQTQMLSELGFKDSYVIAYKTADAGHATVISQDPETGKIVKFNYGEVSDGPKGSGIEAMAMNSSLPDHTLAYRIYDKNGKAVTSVPSQMTQVLRDATNFKDKMVFDKRYQVGKVGFETQSGFGGNLFAGQTSSGEQIYGGALYSEGGDNKHFNASMGLAYAQSKKENDYYYMESSEIYGRFSADVYSSPLTLGKTQSRVFVGADAEVALANNLDKSKKGAPDVEGKRQFETRNAFNAGLRTEGQFNGGDTTVKGEVFAASYIDFEHAAKQDKSTLVYEGTVFKAGLEQQITPDIVALANGAVLVRTYGSSFVTDVGVENKKEKYKFYVGARTPLTSDHPSFLPGGEKVVRIGGEKESESGYYIKVDLEKDLLGNGASATLNAGKKF